VLSWATAESDRQNQGRWTEGRNSDLRELNFREFRAAEIYNSLCHKVFGWFWPRSMDSLRPSIIQGFRNRIQNGERLRLSKEELEALIEEFIEILREANAREEIEALCEAEIKLLEEGYPQASVAKYLTRYRKALGAGIEDGLLTLTETNSHCFTHQQRVTGIREERLEHWALTYLKYSSEVYESIDKRSQQTNQKKQLNLKLVPVNRYLELLRKFLAKEGGTYEARWLASAIAGLTGRRFAEVMAKGTFFLTQHPHLLRFEGQLKSRMERRQGYDIVTLFPAAEVLSAIQRLRRLPEVVELSKLQGTELSAALNIFNQKLNTICGKVLSQVVPPLNGKNTVSVHNLRSLYGAIAVYFFCPELQHEYAFVQHFLGHVMDSPATGHYFRFALCDEQCNPIREKGILLDRVEQLPLGSSIEETELEETELEESESIRFEQGCFELPQGEVPKINGSKLKPEQIKSEQTIASADCLQRLRDEGFRDLTIRVAHLRSEFEEQLRGIEQDADASWFLRRVGALERENIKLRRERDQAIEAARRKSLDREVGRLQAENEMLALQLQKAHQKLDRIRRLLSTVSDSEQIHA
jgi:Telomere resolvase